MANIVRNKNKKWLLLLLHHDYRVLVKVSSIVIQMKHYYLFEGKCVGEWPTQLETKIRCGCFYSYTMTTVCMLNSADGELFEQASLSCDALLLYALLLRESYLAMIVKPPENSKTSFFLTN